MITSNEIRQAIVQQLHEVIATVGGRVHNRERYVKNASGLKKLYLPVTQGTDNDDGTLHGWFVRHSARLPDARHVTDHWLIQGYMGFSDENSSELSFDDTIDALVTAFTGQPLNANVVTVAFEKPYGLQVRKIMPTMFAGILCHQAMCHLETKFFIKPRQN